jgi:hypothetical protein
VARQSPLRTAGTCAEGGGHFFQDKNSSFVHANIGSESFAYPPDAWFDLVWVGFDCRTMSSLARTIHGRSPEAPEGNDREAHEADELLDKVIKLLRQFQARNPNVVVVIENPSDVGDGGGYLARQRAMKEEVEASVEDGGLGCMVSQATQCRFGADVWKILKFWHTSRSLHKLLDDDKYARDRGLHSISARLTYDGGHFSDRYVCDKTGRDPRRACVYCTQHGKHKETARGAKKGGGSAAAASAEYPTNSASAGTFHAAAWRG